MELQSIKEEHKNTLSIADKALIDLEEVVIEN